jgi:hypothetical protein
VSKGGRLNARVTRLELASRVRTATHFSEECRCFPVDEQPEFRWQAEAEAAAKVLCPLHGRRFQTIVTRFLYRALHYYVADFEQGWPHRSAQYQKAMRVSLDPALWPAQEVQLPFPQETQELILRDGTRVQSGGSAVERFQINGAAKHRR